MYYTYTYCIPVPRSCNISVAEVQKFTPIHKNHRFSTNRVLQLYFFFFQSFFSFWLGHCRRSDAMRIAPPQETKCRWQYNTTVSNIKASNKKEIYIYTTLAISTDGNHRTTLWLLFTFPNSLYRYPASRRTSYLHSSLSTRRIITVTDCIQSAVRTLFIHWY